MGQKPADKRGFRQGGFARFGQKNNGVFFLNEYATSLPDLQKDKLVEDDWVFIEMKRLGFFKVEDES